MRNLLTLFIFSILLFSCENTEDNIHVVQADVDGVFYKANNIVARYHTEGEYFLLEGNINEGQLLMKIKYPPANVNLDLSPGTESFGAFTKSNSVYYTTDNENGSGSVIIDNISTTDRTISGEFKFIAMSSGLDTLTVSKGFFYKVNYLNED